MELKKYATMLRIPYFRGVYMKDHLPNKMRKNESMIVNLDDSTGNGTHWVCFCKQNREIKYFDSFGIEPPTELLNYFKTRNQLTYSVDINQNFDEVICGHLCLKFLSNENLCTTKRRS